MPATFDGKFIFGTQIKQEGPSKPYRVQSETLVGVDGERLYRLGDGCRTWTISGRLFAFNGPGMNREVAAGTSYIDGQVYTFLDNLGGSWGNCELTDYRPVGPYSAGKVSGVQGLTVRIQATIRQISPDP